MKNIEVILCLLTSGVLCYLILPMIIAAAHRLGLTDQPGGRKLHRGSIPPFGGLAVFICVVISLFIWLPINRFIGLSVFTGAALFTVILGVRDDIIPTKAGLKLAGQLVVALIIVHLGDIRFHSLYGLFGIQEIGAPLSYAISIFFVVYAINALNLIDGINGLAASLGIVYFLSLGSWFFLSDNLTYATISAAMSGALLSFLRFNLIKPQVFLGDTGSLLIGMAVAMLSIQFIELNDAIDYSDPVKVKSAAAFAICLLIIPLFDTARIFFVRLVILRKSPFTGDKNHIHHLFLKLGFTHSQTTGTLVAINLLFVLLAILLDEAGDFILLGVVTGLCIILFIALDFFLSRKIGGGNKKTIF